MPTHEPTARPRPVEPAVPWDGLFAAGPRIDPEAMFLAWIELVFGPPLPPEARTD
ncbi:hypothetical protein JMJ56_00100 [Belnapia sp. T18]|uniref:Uncharacterized protein n=1 Tax=Belnapia arida TaxID=2804533 RepID=A0ABS1TW17_9PROT|nr:hypothetical protein [Belnapia arida]MBL6076380.1 hypothetical protein [Belnapia arida]